MNFFFLGFGWVYSDSVFRVDIGKFFLVVLDFYVFKVVIEVVVRERKLRENFEEYRIYYFTYGSSLLKLGIKLEGGEIFWRDESLGGN